jgi:hypothetical protein
MRMHMHGVHMVHTVHVHMPGVCMRCASMCSTTDADPGLQSVLAKSELANSVRTSVTLSMLSGSAPGESLVCAPRTARQESNSLTARRAGSTRGLGAHARPGRLRHARPGLVRARALPAN